MAFIDKLFRWKKKPFGDKEQMAKSKEQMAKSAQEKSAGAKSSKPLALSSMPHGSGNLAHIIARPHVSERSSALQEFNQYVFEVSSSVNKDEVRRAVKDLYGIQPIAVKIMNVRGKNTRFGRTSGQTKKWKKAIVTLPAGKTIDVYKK